MTKVNSMGSFGPLGLQVFGPPEFDVDPILKLQRLTKCDYILIILSVLTMSQDLDNDVVPRTHAISTCLTHAMHNYTCLTYALHMPLVHAIHMSCTIAHALHMSCACNT